MATTGKSVTDGEESRDGSPRGWPGLALVLAAQVAFLVLAGLVLLVIGGLFVACGGWGWLRFVVAAWLACVLGVLAGRLMRAVLGRAGYAVEGALGATMARLLFPLVLCVVLGALGPLEQARQVAIALLVFYPLLLMVDTILTVRSLRDVAFDMRVVSHGGLF